MLVLLRVLVLLESFEKIEKSIVGKDLKAQSCLIL